MNQFWLSCLCVCVCAKFAAADVPPIEMLKPNFLMVWMTCNVLRRYSNKIACRSVRKTATATASTAGWWRWCYKRSAFISAPTTKKLLKFRSVSLLKPKCVGRNKTSKYDTNKRALLGYYASMNIEVCRLRYTIVTSCSFSLFLVYSRAPVF